MLPKNNAELGKIFKNAALPSLLEFEGEYYVDMLTVLPSLRFYAHRKVFICENGRVRGYNILFRNFVWGHFYLQEGKCEAMEGLPAVVINYDCAENSFISHKIRDQVRCVEERKLYLGRFNYLLKGKLYFLGYFSLAKIR